MRGSVSLTIFSFALYLLPGARLKAQQNNHWFLGHYASIDFSGGIATATAGALETLEGTAAISDQGGNLLFYTEGSTIWDRDNNVMPNGSGLLGGSSSTQAALIVPEPGACGIYYVFTTQDHLQTGDFRYSVVDMCLNNGYGDVVAGEKNILIHTLCAEKLTAVPNTNGTDYWIITHVLDGDEFLAYSLTPTGFDPVPVISSVGSYHASNCMIGPMKASHDGTRIVCTKTFCSGAELFDFDASTGVVSNPVDLANAYGLPNGCYGAEFSPNDDLLYISTTWAVNRLYQIDLVNEQVEQIAEGQGGGYYFGALQLGADGRIYMARKDENFLDVVEFPDVQGVGCNYLEQGFTLAPGTTSDVGMPCMIPATILESDPGVFAFDLGSDTSFCNGSFILTPPNNCDDFYLWQDGSTANTFTVDAPGTYWVQISNSCGIGADTLVVTNTGQGSIDLIPDTAICAGGSLVLFVPPGADSVLWQDGSDLTEYTVTQAGTYSVQLFDGGCVSTDSVVVGTSPPPTASFTFQLAPCSLTATFENTSEGATAFSWDLDDNTTSSIEDPTHTYPDPGSFSVTLVVENGCGTDVVQQQVDIPDPGQLTLNGPDSLCEGATAAYTADLTGTTMVTSAWSEGSLDMLTIDYSPSASGPLSIMLIGDNGCTFADSLFITLLPAPVADFVWQSQDCGALVQFTDQSTSATQWNWDFGNGDGSDDASPSTTYQPPGPFTVTLTASNPCGNDTTIAELSLSPQGVLDLTGPGTLCANAIGAYALDLTGTDAAAIAWSTGVQDQSEVDLSATADTEISVQVTGTDGCTYADTLAIMVLPLPTADFTWTLNACDSIILFTDASLNATGWSWDLGNGQTGSGTAPVGNYPGPGTYVVELSASNACGNDTDEQAVTLGAIGGLVLSGPSLVCDEEPGTYSASADATSITSILWSTGDTVPAITLVIGEDLLLSATAVGADGCVYSATMDIAVIGAGNSSVAYVPNVFTPNGDGLNETFAPVMADSGAYLEMLIFNRWGREIFSTTSIYDPWDGRFNGSAVPDGTYVYIVRWLDRCEGVKQERYGHVTLLR